VGHSYVHTHCQELMKSVGNSYVHTPSGADEVGWVSHGSLSVLFTMKKVKPAGSETL
jgi:hypothetical protein